MFVEVVAGEVFFAEVSVEDLAVADEEDGWCGDEVVDPAVAEAGDVDGPAPEHEGGDEDDAFGDGFVGAGKCVAGGVGDEDEEHDVGEAYLAGASA